MTNYSILITAYKEAATIGNALDSLLPQIEGLDAEIIVICPDPETAQATVAYDSVRILYDPGEGKPAALNLGLDVAKGDIIIMTDGDVFVAEGAIKALLAPFEDEKVGAVSGRPISLSPRNAILGYWSHLLTEAGAHDERLKRDGAGEFFVCSGYLYAIRAGLFKHIPENSLAEDAVISHLIGLQDWTIRYAPKAEVYVKYPTTYRDWLKQKVRSAGGYTQSIIADSPLRMRSFWHEAISGTRALNYARSRRELIWTLLLIGARLHLWLMIFWRVQIRQMPLSTLWQRVESTK